MYACAHWNTRNCEENKKSFTYQQVWTGVSFGNVFVKVIHNIIWRIGSDLLLKGFINVILEVLRRVMQLIHDFTKSTAVVFLPN